ncbi:histidine phosphatase family protein [Nocardioides pantholopis]|uniref:histidine phosphatase family protein n=1 Tax=Nocardioides pantholopis TaxID=2483798 RepID=UPI000FDC7D9A|nr:histidine phosphatase family protein [Nocardioides pantholopis]
MRPRWDEGPAELVLVRHGNSVGNEADARARKAGAEELDLDARDADVELSATGRDQAAALGAWLREQPGELAPTVAISSPYLRARDTARLALDELRDAPALEHDERLRERDLGVLDGLTGTGIRARHPEEATRRQRLGKFYYQPPSGESWADVAQRVRGLLDDLRHGFDGERVWLFSHQAVIMTFRYVLDGLSEEEVLDLDRSTPIPNASMTTYCRRGPWLELESFADTSAVEASPTDVTREAGKGGRT